MITITTVTKTTINIIALLVVPLKTCCLNNIVFDSQIIINGVKRRLMFSHHIHRYDHCNDVSLLRRIVPLYN